MYIDQIIHVGCVCPQKSTLSLSLSLTLCKSPLSSFLLCTPRKPTHHSTFRAYSLRTVLERASSMLNATCSRSCSLALGNRVSCGLQDGLNSAFGLVPNIWPGDFKILFNQGKIGMVDQGTPPNTRHVDGLGLFDEHSLDQLKKQNGAFLNIHCCAPSTLSATSFPLSRII